MKTAYEKGIIHLIQDVENIVCPYCNQQRQWLTYNHLKGHQKTIRDVRTEFPNLPTMTLQESLKRKEARQSCTDKIKKTCQQKYGGVGFASKDLKEKYEKTTEERYGNRNIMKTEHGKQFFVGENNPQKNPDVRKRTSETLKGKPSKLKGKTYEEILGEEITIRRKKELKRSGAQGQSLTPRISKPQLQLYEIIKQQYPTAILEYPILDYCLDIAVPEKKLCFEYDGSYWHQDKEKDKKRDQVLYELGWKVIRFRDDLPS
jgi:very-short-patch-repair endonuclease